MGPGRERADVTQGRRNMKRAIFLLAVFCLGAAAVFAQQQGRQGAAGTAIPAAALDPRLQLAVASEAYPVTPGDIYRLTFRQGDTIIMSDLMVEGDYTLDMNVFGKLNTTGMQFSDLKPIVEKIVSTAYPRSMPSLTIASIGLFQVFVKGVIPVSVNVNAWGLMRLSEALEGRLGPFSSIRNVEVIAKNGSKKTYDLFKAQGFGIAEQDPYVKPGDTVSIQPADRIVELTGEVRRPGKYQLFPGEQLKELVESYGGGLTINAEATHARIDRIATEKVGTSYVNLKDASSKKEILRDGDSIHVYGKSEWLPVAFFEGAVVPQATATPETASVGMPTQADPAAAAAALAATRATPPSGIDVASIRSYNRILYYFKEGETLSDALHAIRGSLAPLADLTAAVIVRQSSPTPILIDMQQLLVGTNPAVDMPLQPNDRIVIPSLRFTVAVAGAVFFPGNFPYQAGLPPSHYISLAGGVDPERNGNGDFSLTDPQGKDKDKKQPLSPGDRVYVPANAFGYNLQRILPLFASILTVALSTATLITLISK